MGQTVDIKDGNSSADLTALKDDIAALRSDFARLADDTAAVAKSKSSAAADRGRAVASEAADELEAQKSKVEGRVRDNPLMAVGIALGVGALLGALSRR